MSPRPRSRARSSSSRVSGVVARSALHRSRSIATYADGGDAVGAAEPPVARPIPCHPCAASWATSVSSQPSMSWWRACAGWSTAGTTPPGSRCSATASSPSRSGPASSPTSRALSSSIRCDHAVTGMGHTRWATHGAPNDRNAHPHVDCTGSVAVIHNGIIENFASLRAELEAAGTRWSATPTPRSSPTCSRRSAGLLPVDAAGSDGQSTSPRRCARCATGCEGAFTLVAVHVDAPDVVVGARRNSPLVVGRGDGENFLASDVAAFIAHTRDAVELGQDQVVELRRDRVDGHRLRRQPRRGHASTTSTGTPRPPRRAATSTSCSRRSTSSRRPWPTRCSAGSTRTTGWCSTRCGCRTTTSARSTRSSSSPAAPRSTPVWSRSTPSSTGPGSRARSSSRRSSATATRSSTRSTLVVAISQSGETMDTLMALRHAREQRARGARDLQHQRLDDPARVRRRALHPRRPRGRRRVDEGLPHPDRGVLPGRALPRAGARHEVRRRDRRRRRRPAGHAGEDGERPRRPRPGPGTGPPSWPARRRCCSSAGTWATPPRWRVRSSSRSWPTCTPRASRPASSSTGRSR